MNRLLARALPLSLALSTLAACGAASTAPRGVESSFAYWETRDPAAPDDATDPPTIRAHDGGIEVRGLLSAPDPCRPLEASVSRVGDTIDVTLLSKPHGGLCIAVIAEYAYVVGIEDIEPGSHRVRVRYHYPETGWEWRLVADRTVIVP